MELAKEGEQGISPHNNAFEAPCKKVNIYSNTIEAPK
jgi:hypothetical protein